MDAPIAFFLLFGGAIAVLLLGVGIINFLMHVHRMFGRHKPKASFLDWTAFLGVMLLAVGVLYLLASGGRAIKLYSDLGGYCTSINGSFNLPISVNNIQGRCNTNWTNYTVSLSIDNGFEVINNLWMGDPKRHTFYWRP